MLIDNITIDVFLTQNTSCSIKNHSSHKIYVNYENESYCGIGLKNKYFIKHNL